MSIIFLEELWDQLWDSFCHQYDKTEDEMKSLLFNGELNKQEFEKLKSSVQVACLFGHDPDRGVVYFIDYVELFNLCPLLIGRCNWNMLDDRCWLKLLAKMPQFADKCDKWNVFDNDEWVDRKSVV